MCLMWMLKRQRRTLESTHLKTAAHRLNIDDVIVGGITGCGIYGLLLCGLREHAFAHKVPCPQAQGLRWWQDRAGVPTRLAHAEGSSMTVLAAHGLDTATGADACLHEAGQGGGPPPVHESFRTVDCVSKDSASFSGLVAALEEAFRTR